jgi:hypothetical protein
MESVIRVRNFYLISYSQYARPLTFILHQLDINIRKNAFGKYASYTIIWGTSYHSSLLLEEVKYIDNE